MMGLGWYAVCTPGNVRVLTVDVLFWWWNVFNLDDTDDEISVNAIV